PKEHPHTPGAAVGWCPEVSIGKACPLLRLCPYRVVALAAAPEIVHLEISCGLGESQFIEPVVHPVAPVKELNNGGLCIVCRRLRQIEREIKNSKRRALRARQIRLIITVSITMSIYVVASRFIITIIEPAVWRSVRVQRSNRDEAPRHQRRLQRGRSGMTRAQRTRTITSIDAISGFARIIGQAMAHECFAAFRTNKHAKHFAASSAGQDDFP